jgi:hypothetical protein
LSRVCVRGGQEVWGRIRTKVLAKVWTKVRAKVTERCGGGHSVGGRSELVMRRRLLAPRIIDSVGVGETMGRARGEIIRVRKGPAEPFRTGE